MTADELAHQKLHQERDLSHRNAESNAKVLKQKAAQDAARLRRLQDNEDFQWFIANYVQPLHQHNHDEALKLSHPADIRSNFAHRYDVTQTLLELPAKKEAELRTVAGMD